MNKKNIIEHIGEFLKERDNFLITAHYAPDGDNIGACAGMYHALTEAGKNAVIVNEDSFVERFRFLFDGADFPYIKYDEKIGKKYENVIVLDTATFKRIGKVSEIIADGAKVINIDHHPGNELFGSVDYIDTKAASASQIVLEVLKKTGFPISRRVSDSLLSGLLSDTGGLRFGNTNSRAVKDVLELIKYGSDIANLSDRIFMKLSYEETVKVNIVASGIELFKKEKIAMAYNDQENNPLTENEPVLMILSSITEAQVVLFVRRIGENKFKISLRSKGVFDVNQFAAKWGGGGHRNASGIRFAGSYDEFKATLLSDLRKTAKKFYE